MRWLFNSGSRWVGLVVLAALMLLASGASAQEGTSEQPEIEPPDEQRGIPIDIRGSAGRKLTAMAIPDTLDPGEDADEIAEEVAKTLRSNMELSGYFKVLASDGFFFDPSEEGMGTSSIGFQNWFQTGAEALIKSSVRVNGDNVVLDLRLYLVENGQRAELDFSASTATRDNYIDQVHAFSNAVIDYYTGQPGLFGTRIAYVRRVGSSKQIFVKRVGSDGQQRVSQSSSINILPSFGDGSIYYTSYAAGNPDLWVYEGGKRRKLSSKAGQNTGADYCDGKLALTLSQGGENADVYLIDPDSGETQKRLTSHWAIDTTPSFSPDCSKIAFVSGRSGGPQIYVMNADGSDQRRLTHQGSYNTQPTWSPSGDVIAFSARDERNAFDIFTVDLQGNIERLTQDQGNNSDPSFSPDGRYLVFVSDRGGKGKRLWMMTADGQIQHPISEGEGFESPSWEQ
jgi:TolB protein